MDNQHDDNERDESRLLQGVMSAELAITLDAMVQTRGEREGMCIQEYTWPMVHPDLSASADVRVQISRHATKEQILALLIAIRDEVMENWPQLQGKLDKALAELGQSGQDDGAYPLFASPPRVM